MRDSRLISLDILVARKRLQALKVELIAARLAERDRILEMVAAGKTQREISTATGLSLSTIRCVIYGGRLPRPGRVRASRSVSINGTLDDRLRAQLRGAPA